MPVIAMMSFHLTTGILAAVSPVAYMKGLPFSWNWVAGEMDQVAGNIQATNTDMPVDPKYSALANYNKNVGTYHCPADTSVVTGIGPRVRSVSMNSGVGSVWNHPNAATGIVGGGPLPASFLDGSGWSGSGLSKYWKTYNKLGFIINPSGIWVVLDESPFSINDAEFAVSIGMPDANGVGNSKHHRGHAGQLSQRRLRHFVCRRSFGNPPVAGFNHQNKSRPVGLSGR